MKRIGLIAAAIAAISTTQANAVTYSFENISANNVADAAKGEAQLFVDVTDYGAGQVLFNFRNTGPEAMSITQVYFDDGSLLGIAQLNPGGPGVVFNSRNVVVNGGGNSNPNLPSGNTIDFNTTAGFFAVESSSPTALNGVNPGENLGVIFDLVNGLTFADTLAALNLSLANPGVDIAGGLRIGIHVQGFASGNSEAFVNGPPPGGQPPVPDGGVTALLLGAALAGVGVARQTLARK